jgi:hypothetical protein
MMGSQAAQLFSSDLRGLSTADLMQAFLIALLLRGSDDERQKGSSAGDMLMGMALLGALGGAQGACGFSMDGGGGAAGAYAAPAAAASMSVQV